MATKAKKRGQVDGLVFAKAIIEAKKNNECCEDVAKVVGLTTGSVYQRMNRMRNDGVKIPKIPQHPLMRKTSDELNDILAENGLIDQPECDTIPEPEEMNGETADTDSGEEE